VSQSGASGARVITNVVGFDDGPFERGRPGARVLLVGAVCARTRLDGVISGRVTQDGRNAAATVAALVRGSQFDGHVRGVLLNGIAFGGFNVVDIHALAETLARPVLVVARRAPRLALIRDALARLPGGDRKWRLIEQAGPARGPVARRGTGSARGDDVARQHPRAVAARPPDRGRHRHRQEPGPGVAQPGSGTRTLGWR
jgi:endonuclease V-like protein UPF0215 family